MPCIQTKVSIKLSEEKERNIKTRLGQAISILPGKSESWLMVGFEDECRLYFKGSNEQPMAFVEVQLFGKSNDKAYEQLTAEITGILNDELHIDPAQIYVKYEETSHWGWNGRNL